MPLKTLVKVGNITNLSDARYCAGMGVDMLGFGVIEGQTNYIAPALFQQIRGWVSGPKVVAEMYGISESINIDELLANYAPDLVEMTMEDYMRFKSKISLPFIVRLSANNESDIQNQHQQVAYWMIEESLLGGFASTNLPVLMSLDNKEKLGIISNHAQIKGVALNGSHEIRPGFKDYADLAEILESLDDF